MGQKVNPIGLRIGLTQTWRSRWFAEGKKYADFLEEDIKIRKYIRKNMERAAISKIEIERANKSLSIEIHTARPGIVIGKAGAEVDKLKNDLEKLIGKEIQISVKEIRRPELDAVLLAQNVGEQLVGRVPFRRAMKRAVSAAIKSGAKGVKIATAGRLGGHEMARTEWYREGRVPLHTLKADIDYGYSNARTTFGSIGVKVWIYRGDVLPGVSDEETKVELKRKLERIQAEKAAEEKMLEEDLKKMEKAVKEEGQIPEITDTKTEQGSNQQKEKEEIKKEKKENAKDDKKPKAKVEEKSTKKTAKVEKTKKETKDEEKSKDNKEKAVEKEPKKETSKKDTKKEDLDKKAIDKEKQASKKNEAAEPKKKKENASSSKTKKEEEESK